MYSDLRPGMVKNPLWHGKILDDLAAALNGVENRRHSQGDSAAEFEGAIPLKNYHQMVQVLKNESRISLANETIPEDLELFSIFKIPSRSSRLAHLADQQDAASKECKTVAQRCLVAGISRYYNNLLMGIQGNLSLILINMDRQHPYLPIIKSAEELVQSGSFAISLLLGYLSERREQTRRIRFTHLVNEVATSQAYVPEEKDRQEFEQWIKEIPKYDGLAHIAEKCTRSFDRLVRSIATWAEWIRLAGEVDTIISERLLKIRELAETGFWISGKLLAFSGKGNLNLQEVSLRSTFDTVLEEFQNAHPLINIKKSGSHFGVKIMADPGYLHQILHELLQNAAESMPNGGIVTLSAKKLTLAKQHDREGSLNAGTYVEITIKDNGSGLDRKIDGNLFDPFFTTKPIGKGIGLGISMVYGVARQLGGTCAFESMPGYGTQAKLILPRI